ncbi:MAG: transcriptional regulator, partial [Burkholderiales bacterium]|nr:transcriptional regulator [Burkholderiales bacterium]
RTVSGRGYQLAADFAVPEAQGPSRSPLPSARTGEWVSRLIGRESELGHVEALLDSARLVTLVGPGGIGKTSLATEAARQLLSKFPDGICVAELAPLASDDLVPPTVAAALGLSLQGSTVSPRHIAAALGQRKVLLVLDNCEHLVDAVALLTDGLLRAHASIRVLVTSQEPLRVEGEAIYRVPPLGVPAPTDRDPDTLVGIGAVRLFIERAHAAGSTITMDETLAPAIGTICRRLDGIPLAIELAAVCVPALGLAQLAARLDDRFTILTRGRRGSLPRHQTLRATLDWSYQLLSESERRVLRRLALFPARFTLQTATSIAVESGESDTEVVDALTTLVAKSLVQAMSDRTVNRFRLLETTRRYALDKLSASGEFDDVAHRHALHFAAVLERADAECESRPSTEWLAAYSDTLDDVRVALDWAFSKNGDDEIGITLTAASVNLWLQMSLVEECSRRVEQAYARLDRLDIPDERLRMQLLSALSTALLYRSGPGPEIDAAWTRVLEAADRLDHADFRLRALWGLWISHLNSGRYRASLSFAQRFRELAENASRGDLLVGERMAGLSRYFLGDLSEARQHMERVLEQYEPSAARSHIVRFRFDQRITARLTLAQLLWLQGFPDQALRTARDNVDEARRIDHALSLCIVLAGSACPIALWTGNFDIAHEFVNVLLDVSRKHGLGPWHTRGQCFHGLLLVRRGDVAKGVELLQNALADLSDTRFVLFYTTFLGELAQVLAHAGRVTDAHAAIDEALRRAERDEEHWCLAELLRIKGDLLAQGEPEALVWAERYLRDAIDRARKQGALSWELRATLSLCRLLQRKGQQTSAREILATVHARFTEGFASASDLITAKATLASLSDPGF